MPFIDVLSLAIPHHRSDFCTTSLYIIISILAPTDELTTLFLFSCYHLHRWRRVPHEIPPTVSLWIPCCYFRQRDRIRGFKLVVEDWFCEEEMVNWWITICIFMIQKRIQGLSFKISCPSAKYPKYPRVCFAACRA